MEKEEVIDHVRSLDGVLVLAPSAGSEYPEIAWGDAFFYYAPDGQVPQNAQPFATIVTKDYPDDTSSRLEGRWRVNVHAGRAMPDDLGTDPAEADVLVRHPVYGDLGWVAVVTPGVRTSATVLRLIDQAHADARRRWERRAQV
jgi:Family of unknown function (DUF6194)